MTNVICIKGMCVDMSEWRCEDLFDDIADQIECEMLRSHTIV